MNPQVLPRDVLPEAHEVTLTRGSTPVWDTGPHASSLPPLVLLHGWNIDAPTNFGYAVPALAEDRRVIMFDHHGHGHGPRSTDRFTLAAAADDVIEMLDVLGLSSAVMAGYSMGGAIAQLVAHRHPDRCEGLLLMATAGVFAEHRRERVVFAACAAGARAMRVLPDRARERAFDRLAVAGCRSYPDWILDTVRIANPVSLLEAGADLGRFNSSSWIGNLRTPTAVMITAHDTVVAPRRQICLAADVEAIHVETVGADHDLPIRNDPRFAGAVQRSIAALDGVANRNNHLVDAAH